jgi:hypothetical protein
VEDSRPVEGRPASPLIVVAEAGPLLRTPRPSPANPLGASCVSRESGQQRRPLPQHTTTKRARYGQSPMRTIGFARSAYSKGLSGGLQRVAEASGTFALSGRPRGGQRSTVRPPQRTSFAGRPRSTRRSIARWLQICDRHLKVCRNAAMLSSQAAASRPGGRGTSTSSFHLLKVRVGDHFRASCRPLQALIRTGR